MVHEVWGTDEAKRRVMKTQEIIRHSYSQSKHIASCLFHFKRTGKGVRYLGEKSWAELVNSTEARIYDNLLVCNVFASVIS